MESHQSGILLSNFLDPIAKVWGGDTSVNYSSGTKPVKATQNVRRGKRKKSYQK